MVICYNAADIIYMYTVVMATCCNAVYIIHTHAAVMVDCHNAAGIKIIFVTQRKFSKSACNQFCPIFRHLKSSKLVINYLSLPQ